MSLKLIANQCFLNDGSTTVEVPSSAMPWNAAPEQTTRPIAAPAFDAFRN